MKLKALLLACAVAGVFASFALADDGHHGKHHEHGTTTTATTTGSTTTNVTTTTTTTTANCTRVELRGTLASVSPTSFTLTVTKAEDDNDDDNGAGSATPAVGSTVTIAVDANTRVQWQGTGTLTGPNVGDSAQVKALSCASPATLTAQRVNANGPRAGHHEHQHESKNHK